MLVDVHKWSFLITTVNCFEPDWLIHFGFPLYYFGMNLECMFTCIVLWKRHVLLNCTAKLTKQSDVKIESQILLWPAPILSSISYFFQAMSCVLCFAVMVESMHTSAMTFLTLQVTQGHLLFCDQIHEHRLSFAQCWFV